MNSGFARKTGVFPFGFYKQYLLRGYKYGGTSYDVIEVEKSNNEIRP